MKKTKIVPVNDWEWFGHAGHLIVGHKCRFHLCTKVGDYLVSTLGEYWPERASREIHAGVYDSKWLAENGHRKGDDFDAAYMEKFGYETIGGGEDSLYETMVFKLAQGNCECGCGLPNIETWRDCDGSRYATAVAATKGHYEYCKKWADSTQVAAYNKERAVAEGE